jgi:hypothetical protein
MYVNEKMRPVETVPGMEGGEIKDNGGGVNSSIIYLIYCKNFCKCHNVPPPSTTIKINTKNSPRPFLSFKLAISFSWKVEA